MSTATLSIETERSSLSGHCGQGSRLSRTEGVSTPASTGRPSSTFRAVALFLLLATALPVGIGTASGLYRQADPTHEALQRDLFAQARRMNARLEADLGAGLSFIEAPTVFGPF